MLALVKEIARFRELLGLLIVRNIKIRYKNSVLGFFWTLLAPVFMILIYATFLSVLKVKINLTELVTGIIAWQFFAMRLGDSLHAIVGNANLVTKTAFPRTILPLATVGANLVNFLLSSLVLVVFLIVMQASFGAVYWFPLVLVTQCALCLGLALILSCANVFFRDTEHILSVVLLAWFFMTPVIYPIDFVFDRFGAAWFRILYFANPMTGIVTAYRMIFLSVESLGLPCLALSFGVSWLLLFIGIAVFTRHQSTFAEEL